MKVEILSGGDVSPNFERRQVSSACAYPLSNRLADGSILCVYRQGSSKHSPDRILLTYSATMERITHVRACRFRLQEIECKGKA